jgi:hypothetical protein
MFALGLGVLYLGYTVTLYGYILIKGYDVSFAEMFVGTWPPASGPGAAGENAVPSVFTEGTPLGQPNAAAGGGTQQA